MMISRRPVSSPGRVERYRPPFMGFLRNKSRSRRRSKGPLFVRRNKSAAAVTQEPSSPKVTCMGQVRVKRSKPKLQPRSRGNPTRRRCCVWFRNASFYNVFAGKIKSSSFWSKWRSFTFPCSKSDSKLSDSPVSQLDRPATRSAAEEENFKIRRLLASQSSTPPINAFPLTRSRSAPFSSSSLAFRFWEENNQSRCEGELTVRSGNTNPEDPPGATVKVNGVNEPASNVGVSYDGEEVELTELEFVRRPELTRSKSAPARIGEKMVCLWIKKKV